MFIPASNINNFAAALVEGVKGLNEQLDAESAQASENFNEAIAKEKGSGKKASLVDVDEKSNKLLFLLITVFALFLNPKILESKPLEEIFALALDVSSKEPNVISGRIGCGVNRGRSKCFSSSSPSCI